MAKPCNTENMQKFVAALRSGDYIQGRDTLESVSGSGVTFNCCLGVACRVAIKDGLSMEVSNNRRYTTFNGVGGFLPQAVQDWLGIDVQNPGLDIDLYGSTRSATHLNDSDNYDFNQIADAFERTYLID